MDRRERRDKLLAHRSTRLAALALIAVASSMPAAAQAGPAPKPAPRRACGPICYSDTFSGTVLNRFWNASSRVYVVGGHALIAAGGHWLGATRKPPGFARQLVVHVLAGDRPGVVLWNHDPGGEVLDLTEHDGLFSVRINHRPVGSWPFPASNRWWRIRSDGTEVSIATSSDGRDWTLAGHHAAQLGGGVDGLLIDSAGDGVGAGTSTQPTVVDSVRWQEYEPRRSIARTRVTARTLDDGRRPSENPLSDGHKWLTPGFPDHSPMRLSRHRFIGDDTNGAAVWSRRFGHGMEAWARIGAPASRTTEYTLFAEIDPRLAHKQGYDCWIAGDRLWAARFDAPYSTYTLIPGIRVRGGPLAAGDALALVVERGRVIVDVKRGSRPWQTVAHVLDDAHRSGGLLGFALIDHRGVAGSFSALGGGAARRRNRVH